MGNPGTRFRGHAVLGPYRTDSTTNVMLLVARDCASHFLIDLARANVIVLATAVMPVGARFRQA